MASTHFVKSFNCLLPSRLFQCFAVRTSTLLQVKDAAEGCFGSVEAVRESFLVLGRRIGIRRVQCVFELVVQPS